MHQYKVVNVNIEKRKPLVILIVSPIEGGPTNARAQTDRK